MHLADGSGTSDWRIFRHRALQANIASCYQVTLGESGQAFQGIVSEIRGGLEGVIRRSEVDTSGEINVSRIVEGDIQLRPLGVEPYARPWELFVTKCQVLRRCFTTDRRLLTCAGDLKPGSRDVAAHYVRNIQQVTE